MGLLDNFSIVSRSLVFISIIQAIIVIILQSVIIGVGDWNPASQGGLGVDRKVYAVLFIICVAYSIFLGYDALLNENIIQVFAFLFMNCLYSLYGATQVFQFRNIDDISRPYEAVDYLAIASVIVLGLCSLVFTFLSYRLYMEFGWRIYKKIGADPRIRSMYRTYQIFRMILKVDLPMVIVFLIQHCAILLSTSDAEFILSIIAIPVIFVIIALAYWAAKNENYPTFAIYLLVIVGALAYFAFKFYRFVTKSCPSCVAEISSGNQKSFIFLSMFSGINFIILLFTLVVSIFVIANFNKDLKDYLDNPDSGRPKADSVTAGESSGRTMALVI